MSAGLVVSLACAILAIVYGALSIKWIMKQPEGSDRMREISGAIQEGASAYFKRQYSAIAWVGVVLFVILWVMLDEWTAIGFAIGAIFSGLAGYIGMSVSVRANNRTAEAAFDGLNPAMQIAFRGGAITGLLVIGLGLLGVAGYYYIITAFGHGGDHAEIDEHQPEGPAGGAG